MWAVMRKGELVEQGPTEQLFKNMTHPYTKQLFEASNHQPERAGKAQDVPILEVRNAIREYATPRTRLFNRPAPFRAVNDVSFTVDEGRKLGLGR